MLKKMLAFFLALSLAGCGVFSLDVRIDETEESAPTATQSPTQVPTQTPLPVPTATNRDPSMPSAFPAESVFTARLSPDGTLLAAGSGTSVLLWDIASGELLRTFSSPSDQSMIDCLAFSPDGSRLVAGPYTTMLSMWNVADGSQVGSFSALPTDAGKVSSVAFSPDGQLLAVGMGGALSLLEADTGEAVYTIREGLGSIQAMSFSPAGDLLATGSEDDVILWDVAAGQRLSTFSGHTEIVGAVAFSPDGQVLASGGADGNVILWDVASGEQLHILIGHTYQVNRVSFSSDGTQLLSTSVLDPNMIAWDVATGAQIRLRVGIGDVWDSDLSADGSLVTIATSTWVFVWNYEEMVNSPVVFEVADTPIMSETPSPAPTSEPQAAVPHFTPGQAVFLTEIHMVTAAEGWGLSGPYLLTTADGGYTWRDVTPPQFLPDGVEALAFGAFPSAQSAWVVYRIDGHIPWDAVVWSTVDGGRTWRGSASLGHRTSGDASRAIFSVLNEYTGWLMVRGSYVATGQHHSNQLFQTLDGGVTWTSLGLNEFGANGLAFGDSQTGWMTLDCSGDCYPSAEQVVETLDGGRTWQFRRVPEPSGIVGFFPQHEYCNSYQPYALTAAAVRFLVSCYDYPLTEMETYFYAMDYGGSSWWMTLLPASVSGPQAALVFFGTENGLLLGREMYRTTDSGQTWEKFKTVTWDGQFSFIDPRTGWAIAGSGGQSLLVYTSNGGLTWEEITPHIAP